MALSATDMLFVYPEYTSVIQDDKVGGVSTAIELTDPNVDDEIQLFNHAMLYSGTYVQYQKIFIKNNGDETALNVEVYGYNRNDNGVMKMALERGQDQEIVYDGEEKIKNNITRPHLYTEYTFAEISGATPLSISNIAEGECVGIWLKLEFSSIDAYASKDEFMVGINFEGVAATPLNAEQIIGHSRISGSVNIIKMKASDSGFKTVDIDYEWVDTSVIGIAPNEAVYGIYVDKIKKQENFGTSRARIQLYSNDVPCEIEVYLLPYSGYEIDFSSATTKGNRVRILWTSRNPDLFDIERHIIYWDNATGTYLTRPMVEMDAKDLYGGGDGIEILRFLEEV